MVKFRSTQAASTSADPAPPKAAAAAAPIGPVKGKEATWIDSVIVFRYIDITSFKEVGRGQAMMINSDFVGKALHVRFA